VANAKDIAKDIFNAAQQSVHQLVRLMNQELNQMDRGDIMRAARKAQAAAEDLQQLAGYLYSKLPKNEGPEDASSP
jgi:enoyl-CoA hydratase/carnithine racemase